MRFFAANTCFHQWGLTLIRHQGYEYAEDVRNRSQLESVLNVKIANYRFMYSAFILLYCVYIILLYCSKKQLVFHYQLQVEFQKKL